MKRPLSVTLLAWAFILLPVLIALWIIGASTMMVDGMSESLFLYLAISRPVLKIFPEPYLFILVGGLWAFLIVAGIAFLRLRPWSRLALEIVSWLIAVYLLADWLFWLQGSPMPLAMTGTMIVTAVPVMLVIACLRSKTVRRTFS